MMRANKNFPISPQISGGAGGKDDKDNTTCFKSLMNFLIDGSYRFIYNSNTVLPTQQKKIIIYINILYPQTKYQMNTL